MFIPNWKALLAKVMQVCMKQSSDIAMGFLKIKSSRAALTLYVLLNKNDLK